jgi:precorrin-2 dehydrogenase/sirohydrochlorin ferrochelatase
MTHYPIILTGPLAAVVIGGGQVAERKVQGLLQGGAEVTVISPRLSSTLAHLAQTGHIRAILRCYLPGDLAGARLAIAATNDAAVNAAVAEEACQLGCLINVVDDPQRCTFYVPAVIRRGEVAVSVSTAAASPALARYLRRQLEASIPPEYGQLAGILAELRPQWRAGELRERPPELAWEQLIEAALALLKEGRIEEAHELARRFIRQEDGEGAR